jgi:hypothetical protein
MWRVLGGNVLYSDRREVAEALKENDPVTTPEGYQVWSNPRYQKAKPE